MPAIYHTQLVNSDFEGAIYHVQNVGGAISSPTMPTASADYLDTIIQYTGATDSNYTNGYFYKCESDGAATPTYTWTQIDVQPGGSTGSANTSLSNLNATGEAHFAKPTATGTLTSGTSTTMADNTVYTGTSMTSITLAFPASPASTFVSEAQITTGTGTITFAVDSGTTMKGSDTDEGTFTPSASSTYSIMFGISGSSKYGIVVKI